MMKKLIYVSTDHHEIWQKAWLENYLITARIWAKTVECGLHNVKSKVPIF